MTFFYKLIDFSQTCWYIISITIISGVNFRPKQCWAKVKQKSCEPKTRKNVIFRYTGSRKMSISDVIVVIEKKWDMFWRVDVMRSTQKKNHQNPSTNKKSAGGGQNHPPLGQPPNLKDVNIPRVNLNLPSWNYKDTDTIFGKFS